MGAGRAGAAGAVMGAVLTFLKQADKQMHMLGCYCLTITLLLVLPMLWAASVLCWLRALPKNAFLTGIDQRHIRLIGWILWLMRLGSGWLAWCSLWLRCLLGLFPPITG